METISVTFAVMNMGMHGTQIYLGGRGVVQVCHLPLSLPPCLFFYVPLIKIKPRVKLTMISGSDDEWAAGMAARHLREAGRCLRGGPAEDGGAPSPVRPKGSQQRPTRGRQEDNGRLGSSEKEEEEEEKRKGVGDRRNN